MEKISTKKIPPIFKMSMLWNILPYYGHLHRWRRLLEMINTETKDIWDQNREQLMYTGRDFKREIELDSLKVLTSYLRPNRSWLDLFSLSLSDRFNSHKFDFTTLTDNLSEDEVIIIDSHDNIFKGYQIHIWRKEYISDILPAIKCPSFKSETKMFKTSEMKEMIQFINDQNHTKSTVVENTDGELSINLVYGDTIKIASWTLTTSQHIKFLYKVQERYKLWENDECACKAKKIRVWKNKFEGFQNTIKVLEKISNINDVKLGMYINYKKYNKFASNYDSMVFNHSARWTNDVTSKFMFSGDSLTAMSKGDSYNFRLDETTKKSINSYIRGRI